MLIKKWYKYKKKLNKVGNFHIKITRTNIFLTLTSRKGAVVFSCSGGFICQQKKIWWKLRKTWSVAEDVGYFIINKIINANYTINCIFINGRINKKVWNLIKLIWRTRLGGLKVILWLGLGHNGLRKKKKRWM